MEQFFFSSSFLKLVTGLNCDENDGFSGGGTTL